MNEFNIDISNYISGSYVYNINIDGFTVKNGTFNIVK